MTSTAELNLRVLRGLAEFVLDRFGEAALARIVEEARLSLAQLDGKTRWATVEQFDAVLGGVRALLEDDAAFMRACCYRYAEGLGPLRFNFGILSPRVAYEMGCRAWRPISRISDMTFLGAEGHRVRMRYTTRKRESRLMCLSRMAQLELMPTLWGLPPAQLSEHGCVALGAEACEYEILVHEHRRAWPLLFGSAAATLAGCAALAAGATLTPLGVAGLAAIGLVAGYVYELRRTTRENLRLCGEANDALRHLSHEDAEARRELLDLCEGKRAWEQVMEEQLADRTTALLELTERVVQVRAELQGVIAGLSHDLRAPLQFLRLESALLRQALSEDRMRLVETHDRAVTQIDRLIDELMNVTTPDATLVPLAPENIDVASLADRLGRRLRALAYGRDLVTGVTVAPGAPPSIRVDPLAFDRILDNLVSNALKYTQRGSVRVELDGTPELLTVTVVDTGRGIAEDAMERAFLPGGSDRTARASDSHGLGLSIVIRLLAQLGGRLEVTSRVGEGTTFWVSLPTAPAPASLHHEAVPADARDLFRRVVTLRKAAEP